MLLGGLLQRFVWFGRIEERRDKCAALRLIQPQQFAILGSVGHCLMDTWDQGSFASFVRE